jgi:hypothetical protein
MSKQVKGVKVILSIDLMSFTGITFCVTVARDVHFITASFLQERQKATILKAIRAVMDVHKGILKAIRAVMDLHKGKGHIVEEVEYNEYSNPVHTILADNKLEAL